MTSPDGTHDAFREREHHPDKTNDRRCHETLAANTRRTDVRQRRRGDDATAAGLHADGSRQTWTKPEKGQR